jgi:hypothetical protein
VPGAPTEILDAIRIGVGRQVLCVGMTALGDAVRIEHE